MKKIILALLCLGSIQCGADPVQDQLDERNRQEEKIQLQKLEDQRLNQARIERKIQDQKLESQRLEKKRADDAAWDRAHGRV